MRVKNQMILGVVRFILFSIFVVLSFLLAIITIVYSTNLYSNILAATAILIGVSSLTIDGILTAVSSVGSGDNV